MRRLDWGVWIETVELGRLDWNVRIGMVEFKLRAFAVYKKHFTYAHAMHPLTGTRHAGAHKIPDSRIIFL